MPDDLFRAGRSRDRHDSTVETTEALEIASVDAAAAVDSAPLSDAGIPVDVVLAGGTDPVPASGTADVRSRARKVVLGSLLAVALAGAAAMAVTAWRIVEQKDARLDAPPELAGLTRDDSEQARSTTDYLRGALAAGVDVDASVGVVYADPADSARSVLVFGGTGLLWRPERELDALLELLSDDSGALTGVGEVPAGDLGGVMKCGTAKSPDGDLAACGWADYGSVVIAMFPGRDAGESAGLMGRIRAGMQTRT